MPLTAALADAPISPDLDSPLPQRVVGPRIFDRFLAVCRERPAARAIVHPGGAWTYAEVERASRALAHQLRALPATDDVVALYGKRSGELVVAMLACARAGLTFAVLDAAYPIERIQLLLGVLSPGRFVAIGDVVLAGLAVPAPIVHLDSAAITASPEAAAEGLDAVRPETVAYLLFTSGTTGVPKCIATSHVPLAHFVGWYEKTFAVEPSARVSMLSGLGHDPVLRDVFVPLSTGAELHIPPPATVLDPAKLHGWFADQQITHAHVTPQLSRILCAGKRAQPLASLRYVFSGGDVLRVRQALEIASLGPSTKVVNFYGSTETPQAMAFHVFDPRGDTSESVPIGRGIDDVQVFVLDDKLGLAEGSGQVAIRTRYLSEGYRGDATLTHAKFVANPRSADPTDRLYLTGDLGRRSAGGAVILEGRVDDQVKIRGFRVELGDVVHQLHQLPLIKEAVVLSEKLPDGEARLVAYAISTDGREDTASVREAMTAAAPAYMVPARFVWLDAFPLLPNGKIDRGKLRSLEPVETAPAQELDPTEAAIAAHWRELLGRPAIDVEQSFVTLGGDSLSFIEASVKLEQLLGNLPEAWEKLSIRELATQKRSERSKWTHVDAAVFLRAVSIVAVVAAHMALPNLAGSVLALFVVSGMSFGRYLGPQIQQSGTVTPIAKLVVKIGVPAALYALALNVAYHLPKWPGLILANNLVHHDSKISGMGFWYIDVLFQCFVVLALLLALRPIRRLLVEGDPFHVLAAMTMLFVGIALAAQYFFDLSHLYDRTPLYYLRAVFLGWTLIYATTLPRKLLVLALTIPVFGDNAWNYEEDYVWFPFVATAFLAFVPRVPLPVLLGRLVTIVASASLFIYLTDHQTNLVLLKVAERAGIPDGVPYAIAMTVVAVVAGIVLYRIWDFAISRFAPRAVRGWL